MEKAPPAKRDSVMARRISGYIHGRLQIKSLRYLWRSDVMAAFKIFGGITKAHTRRAFNAWRKGNAQFEFEDVEVAGKADVKISRKTNCP